MLCFIVFVLCTAHAFGRLNSTLVLIGVWYAPLRAKMVHMLYVDSEASDQTAHVHNLISGSTACW